jgi:hypothetical protein
VRLPEADLRVAVYGNWDFAPALRMLSPGGSRAWHGVHFGRAEDIADPDFVLVLNTPGRDGVTLDMPPERVWFASGEPPPFRDCNLGQGTGTVVLTCDDALAADPPADRTFELGPPFCRTWSVKRSYDALAALELAPKTGSLSWVTSNKAMLAGHKRRLVFLAWIRHKVEFDLYGRGFAPIADKWEGLAPYRYSIAFENHRSPHYFTEKIMDCFVCRTMPLYFGCPQIGRYFPKGSYVEFDPDDPRVAERIDEIVRSDLHAQARDALEEARRLVLDRYNMLARLAGLMRARLAPPGPRQRMTLRG